jgi:type VI secretion system secreted protein Hcp
MALNAYLTLTGVTQGLIVGPVTKAGREDTIEILETKHLVHYPLDAVSGQLTSQKKHKPITLTKEIDKTSPQLFNMWMTNENITLCTIEFYKNNSSGQEVQFYTIELEGARIASIRFEHQNTLDPETQPYPITEQITLVYSKITITHPETGNVAVDDLMTG